MTEQRRLDLASLMPFHNVLKARRLWEGGERRAGFRLLNTTLAARLGAEPFLESEQLLTGTGLDSFYLALSAALLDNDYLALSFSSVFTELWNSAPLQILITILKLKDFSVPSFAQSLGLPDPPIERFETIADALCTSASLGLLSPDASDYPNGGRAVLPLEDLEQADPRRWGNLKSLLQTRLPKSFELCPPDFWNWLTRTDPEGVVVRFLYHIFGEYLHPESEAEARWAVVLEQHPRYAQAVRESLGLLLKAEHDEQQLTEIVRLSTGINSVKHGYSWLQLLQIALETAKFNTLQTNDNGLD